jgi:histidinol-phosphatase (PHP family)
VLFGAEADYYEGCERFLREWLPHRPFDLVLGSVHFINDWGFDNPDEREVWDNVDVAGTWREYFKLIGRLAETKLFDVVGHLDLPKKFGFLPAEPVLREIAGPALDKIANARMAIEINTSGLRKPVREIYPSLFLLGMARALDIPVCFGSDAHLPDEVGYEFACALAWARQAGYSEAVRFAGRKQTRYALPVQHVAANPFPASGETGCRRAP